MKKLLLAIAVFALPLTASANRTDEVFQQVYGTPGATVTVSCSTVSAASSALREDTVYRLYASADVFVVFADSPTATTSDMPLAGALPEYFSTGNTGKVACITASGTATLYITRMVR